MESHPWARSVTGKPDGPGVLRMSRSNRERTTQRVRYIAGSKDSEGEGNSTTVGAQAATSAPTSMTLSTL